ncbi:hypothetical protein LTR15_005486 [Elasticomyces elasticus]|nr:hypothetical protein LTR15_005486 [Elasticomyces elasticus]
MTGKKRNAQQQTGPASKLPRTGAVGSQKEHNQKWFKGEQTDIDSLRASWQHDLNAYKASYKSPEQLQEEYRQASIRELVHTSVTQELVIVRSEVTQEFVAVRGEMEDIRSEMALFFARLEKLEDDIGEDPSAPAPYKPGDWKKKCSLDYHLHTFLKDNQAKLRKEYRWVETEEKTTTQEGCMPLRLFTNFKWVTAGIGGQKAFTHHCSECNRSVKLAPTHARWILASQMALDELWKLCERTENGRRAWHASHECKLPASEECWNKQHIHCETLETNLGPRKQHQNGGFCDCAEEGRVPCRGPNQLYKKDQPLNALAIPTPTPIPTRTGRHTSQGSRRQHDCTRCTKLGKPCDGRMPCNTCVLEKGPRCQYTYDEPPPLPKPAPVQRPQPMTRVKTFPSTNRQPVPDPSI